jgi:FlaA1/EpsC-like NDP-sugar epimerase
MGIMKRIGHKNRNLIAEIGIDLISVFLSAVASLLITQRGTLSPDVMGALGVYLCYSFPMILIMNMMLKVYKQMWEFVSVSGLSRIFLAVFLNLVVVVAIGNLLDNLFSFSFYFLNFFFIGFFAWAFRVRNSIKRKFASYLTRFDRLEKQESFPSKKNTLLAGAGQAAALLLQNYESNRRESPLRIIGMVDDDKSKRGLMMHGVKVLGECRSIPDIVKAYCVQEIIVAIPSARADAMNVILDYCRKTKCRIRVMPHLDERMDSLSPENFLAPSISDLIGRQEYEIDTDAVQKMIVGKRVMVTGGGGSIGSELCRQIMRFGPEKLVIVDIYENSTYDLYKELVDTYGIQGQAAVEVRICSILNEHEIEKLFKRFLPEIVFHAAAYKHVPLMELCPKEAVKNNIIGTYILAGIAAKYEVKKFLLVSTDKAVNPTNIMGATKRAAELIVFAMQKHYVRSDFIAVRFGNVLGSNGSVVVQFKRQINAGGPVTVTHPDIIRYFMTISEAVSLVLEAMSFARGGELYVLDMGSPVKIDNLARMMIKSAGLRPEVDIKIAYTGLRPGEKLYEELLIEEEGILKTENEKIFVTHPKDVGMEYVQTMVKRLGECLDKDDNIKETLKLFIDTFRDEAHAQNAMLPNLEKTVSGEG